jgi:hypothetical protein
MLSSYTGHRPHGGRFALLRIRGARKSCLDWKYGTGAVEGFHFGECRLQGSERLPSSASFDGFSACPIIVVNPSELTRILGKIMAMKRSPSSVRRETTPDERVRREATPDEIEAAVTHLKGIWKAGNLLRPLLKSKDYHFGKKRKLMIETAKRRRIKFGFDTLGKAVRIASEYTESEIDGICAQVCECKSRFGATHLIRLLALNKKKERQKLVDQAIQRRWMTHEAQQAAWQIRKRIRPCGRMPITPENELTCAIALGSYCLRWRRWMEGVDKVPGLPASIQRKAKNVTDSIRELERAIDKHVASARGRGSNSPPRRR